MLHVKICTQYILDQSVALIVAEKSRFLDRELEFGK
jgi:hypothetical protein